METLDTTARPVVADRRASVGIWTRRIVVAALWIVVVLIWRNYQTSNDLSATDAAQRFIDNVDMAWWAFAAYVGVYLVRPVVLFPASVLTVVGGLLFGPIAGVLVVIIAANSSAMVAYAIGRTLGRSPLDDDGEARTTLLERWSDRMRTRSFETVLVMRLLFLPYDLVNYAAGFLRIKAMPFLVATALGSLPGTVSFVLLGASLDRVDQGLDGIDPVALIAGVVIFGVSLMTAHVLRRRTATPRLEEVSTA